MRVKKSARSLLYGVSFQFVNILLSFVVRRALVHTLGMTAVSLNGLFNEVIAMLSLAEMGVGTAIVYNLYKPLAMQDEEKLAQLMNLFQKAYRIIAAAILFVGVCLLPFIHLLINKVEIDLGYLRLVYFLFLSQTASSYLFSYKTALFNADQKAYVVSISSLLVRVATVAVNIGLLYLTHNFIVYLLIEILCTVTTNIVISVKADKTYPFLKHKEKKLPKEEQKNVFSNVKHLFIGTLSGKITNSTDNILISILVGTLHIGAFTSYTMFSNSVKRILEQLQFATSGSVGNLMAEGDMELCDSVLKRLTFITYFLVSAAATGLFVLSTPFVKLLFGTEYVLGWGIVFFNSYTFFFYILRNPLWQFLQVSGLFAKDKYISILGSAVNLFLSFLLGKMIGISGILIGTISTIVIQAVLKVRLLYKNFFKMQSRSYYWMLLSLSLLCAVEMIITFVICKQFTIANIFFDIFVKALIAGGIPLLLNTLLLYRTEEFHYFFELLKVLLKKMYYRKGRLQ